MLPIVIAPSPVLSQKAKRITKIDKPLHSLIQEMSETLINAKDPEGVGLAAPQVGKPLQLFIVRQTDQSPIQAFINPAIEKVTETKKAEDGKTKPQANKKSVKLEGCLSLVNIWGVVRRSNTVFLSYLDPQGIFHRKRFTGFIATIIQHEVDHLNGVLFPKRVLEQHGKLYKSSKDEKNEMVFEEISI